MDGMIQDLENSLLQLKDARHTLEESLHNAQCDLGELEDRKKIVQSQLEEQEAKLEILRSLPQRIQTTKWHETCNRLDEKVKEAKSETTKIEKKLEKAKNTDPQSIQNEIDLISKDIKSTEDAIALLKQ